MLLDMDPPKIYAYSATSAIAEKLEAIVSLGFLNSRYKDFYDIYILAGKYEMDEATLAESIRETFEHRDTGFDDIPAFTEDFYNDPMHQIRWNAFTRKKKALVQVELKDVIERIRRLALPVIEDIKSGSIQKKHWDASEEMWKLIDDNSENRY